MSSASIAALAYAASIAIPSMTSPRPDDKITAGKAHHMPGGGFDNPWPSWTKHSVWTILKGMGARRWNKTANIPDTTPPTVPVRTPEFLPSRSPSSPDALRATWLGHACYHVEFPSGLRVLFDPVFTDRCSPFSFMGPKRYTKMPCEIKDIPIVDAVIISHNHYDHLSYPTIMEIAKRHPNAHFFVPLGNKKWFAECDIQQCTELDWWDEVDFTLTPSQSRSQPNGNPSPSNPSITSTTENSDLSKPAQSSITARISCLPCQHTSARSLTDRAKTLWASWSVHDTSSPSKKSVYFAGDTGYRSVPFSSEGQDDYSSSYSSLPTCPAFSSIGKFRGPFTLGLIPIGAYSPRWVMSPMHANPRDSVEIFKDTNCQRALGMHWGTWVLTEEDVLEPPKRLREALKLKGVEEVGVFDVCDIGESRQF